MKELKKVKREIMENNRRIESCNDRIIECFRVICRGVALDNNYVLNQGKELFDELDTLRAQNAILKEYVSNEEKKINKGPYFKL